MKARYAFLSIVLALLCAVNVNAASSVSYVGQAGGFIYDAGSEHSPTDLFKDFKDMMPGDAVTSQLTLRNDASKEVKVKIYLRSLGAQEGSEEFLSQLKLKVRHSDENEMAYMFDAAASEPSPLGEWIYLGMLYSGGVVNLDVSLEMPITVGNEFSDKVGYLDWEFMIEEFPVEESDPDTPQTGDDTRLGPWIASAVGAGAAIIILIFWYKRKKDEEETKQVK